jgi:hypothetical protein
MISVILLAYQSYDNFIGPKACLLIICRLFSGGGLLPDEASSSQIEDEDP